MLNNIQNEVIDFLEERSNNGLYTNIKMISNHLCEKGFFKSKSPRNIKKIINSIRNDLSFDNIIITDYNKGYKIMTENDSVDLLTKRKTEILKMFELYNLDVKRYNKHNQLSSNENGIEAIKVLL